MKIISILLSNISNIFLLGLIIFNFLLARLIFKDAKENNKRALNIPPWFWFVGVLFSSFLGVLTYWLINYSNLSDKKL